MKASTQDLRYYRKQTCLTQKDCAFLLGTKDVTQFSRHENGSMHPQLEICMLYHLIFGIPIQNFFPNQKSEMRKRLIVRLPNIIDEYKCLPQKGDIPAKISFFNNVLSVLHTQTV